MCCFSFFLFGSFSLLLLVTLMLVLCFFPTFLQFFLMDDSEVCEGLLSQDEYFVALQGMALGKAPGCDGLPMEFYLKFWHVLGFDLVCVLNSTFGLGSVSLSVPRYHTLSFKKRSS